MICHENLFFPTNGSQTNTNFSTKYAVVTAMITTKSNNAIDSCKTVFFLKKRDICMVLAKKEEKVTMLEETL